MYTLFVLNPILWAMGLGGFVWSMAAVPLVVWVLLRRDACLPPATALFAIYVSWAMVSVIRIDTAGRLMVFGLRAAGYVTALCLAIYVYNERRVSRTTFVNWVAMFWVWAIIGGYVGLLLPRLRLSITPASLLLPRSLANNEFVANLTRPRFAQVQNIFGTSIPRPSALFAFTNEWGSAVGLLTPFFIAATLYSPQLWKRRAGIIGLLIGLPPMILSVNRGLWISVGATMAIVAVRSYVAGRTAPLKLLAGVCVFVTVLVVGTPVGEIVTGRLSESDAGARAGIYAEAWAGALASPFVGWGGPRPSINPFSPAVGTHGHIWFAMFSHGLVGLVLYLTWLIWAMYLAIQRRDPISIMLASVVYVGALQMFFYNALPVPLPIILVAIGLLFRNDDRQPNTDIVAMRTASSGSRTRVSND